jgi:hypothetical protein
MAHSTLELPRSGSGRRSPSSFSTVTTSSHPSAIAFAAASSFSLSDQARSPSKGLHARSPSNGPVPRAPVVQATQAAVPSFVPASPRRGQGELQPSRLSASLNTSSRSKSDIGGGSSSLSSSRGGALDHSPASSAAEPSLLTGHGVTRYRSPPPMDLHAGTTSAPTFPPASPVRRGGETTLLTRTPSFASAPSSPATATVANGAAVGEGSRTLIAVAVAPPGGLRRAGSNRSSPGR